MGFFAASASAADCQGALTKLSACPRDADKNVVIGSGNCVSVAIDQSPDDYGRITSVDTNGAMCVRDADLKGRTRELLRQGHHGQGDAADRQQRIAPIGRSNRDNNVRIMFKGERPTTVHDAAHAMAADQTLP